MIQTQNYQKETKTEDNDLQKSTKREGSLKDESRRLLPELLGTFALALVAAGGEVIAVISGGAVSPAARAVAPGLLVMAMIYTLGSQSGAHFNPVVTLAFTLRQDFPWKRVPGYWGAQMLGAILAALLLRAIFGLVGHLGATLPHHGTIEALVIEIVLTFLLVTVILGTATNHRLTGPNAALAVAGGLLAVLVAWLLRGRTTPEAVKTAKGH
jgi:aquaporin Z